MNGPKFLKEPISKDDIKFDIPDDNLELKKELSTNVVNVVNIKNVTHMLIHYFSGPLVTHIPGYLVLETISDRKGLVRSVRIQIKKL